MTTQENFANDNFTNESPTNESNIKDFYHSIWETFKFNDNIFEELLPVVNDEARFIDKLFELVGFDITMDFDGLMYSVLLEAFTVEAENNPQFIDTPRELIALRYADRIKESIKKYTPEYYNFLNYINYYDYRLLDLLNDNIENPREIIESVLREKAISFISDFIDEVFPELDSLINDLDDDIISFIMPKILEYNRTTRADREVVMSMIANPEALFTLKTENNEMSNIIIETLMEEIERKRKKIANTQKTDNNK